MEAFDLKIDTTNVNVYDFNNAVNYLRYIDARCSWSYENFEYEKKPACFNEQQLTAEEYYKWLTAVFVFIERCPDFYPPNDNFSLLFNNFDMSCLMEHYLEIYIIINFLFKKKSYLFYYEVYGLADMQKSLTEYVNSSSTIQQFLNTYSYEIELDANKYKDYGSYLGEEDFLLDCFPFKCCKMNICKTSIDFSAMLYTLKKGKLYKLTKYFLDYKYFEDYFNSNPKYKKEFYDIISIVTENQKKIAECEDKLITLYEAWGESSDVDISNQLKSEVMRTENSIKKLKCVEDFKKLILNHPDILPYSETK